MIVNENWASPNAEATFKLQLGGINYLQKHHKKSDFNMVAKMKSLH